MQRTSGRPKKPKKSRRPKRLTIAEQAVQKMPTRIRNSTHKRSWAELDEDDSLFLPTNRTIGSESCNKTIPMTCVEVVSPTKNDTGTIEKDTDGNDVILGDILIHKETILQLEKIMKSIPKTKATVLLNEYVEKSIAERKIIEESSELSSVKLSYLVDDYNLPTSSMKELGAILFGISRLEKRGVVTRTQIRGKNLSSLSSLKKQIATLSKQCMVEQPESPTPTTDSIINDNDSDDNSSTKNKEDT